MNGMVVHEKIQTLKLLDYLYENRAFFISLIRLHFHLAGQCPRGAICSASMDYLNGISMGT